VVGAVPVAAVAGAVDISAVAVVSEAVASAGNFCYAMLQCSVEREAEDMEVCNVAE
jgi:hypothetical protein